MLLGAITQAGFVVPDIDKAMKHWTSVLGVGPFFYIEHVPVEDYQFRGKNYDLHFSVALANSGPLQIELIQQRDKTPSLYAEFTEAGRWGLQHVAFWTEKYDEDFAALEAKGFVAPMSGRVANGRFAYFDTELHPGTVLELSEITGRKGDVFKIIRDASTNWDGSDPVRQLPFRT